MLRTPGGISTCLQISANSKQVLQIKLGGTRKKYFLVFGSVDKEVTEARFMKTQDSFLTQMPIQMASV